MKNIVRFTVTHDVDTGCNFGKELAEVVPEKQTRDWIGSYISEITAYATEPRYLSKGIDSVSYFYGYRLPGHSESFGYGDHRGSFHCAHVCGLHFDETYGRDYFG